MPDGKNNSELWLLRIGQCGEPSIGALPSTERKSLPEG